MELYYENSKNEKIDFMSPPYLARDISEILDYDWNYQTGSKGIEKFYRDICEIPLTINVIADNEKDYKEACEHFYKVVETDILEKKEGKFWCNGYYVLCNLIRNQKKDWCMGIDYHMSYLTLLTDKPFWIKEYPYTFKESEVTSTNNKRYPGRYAYRYANGLSNTYIVNDHYAECNFKINIYGPCTKPSVYIGGYEYHVDIVLQAGEYLEIDSAAETVTKVMTSGIRVNAFNNRSFVNSVFRPIQTGKQEIFWDGKFDFDLILFEERSEPKWQ